LEEDVQDQTIEAEEAEEGEEEEKEPSQEPEGITLGSYDTSEDATPSLHSHMQDTVHVEDELLPQRPEDVGVIHHVRDENQHIGIGGNFVHMHSSRSGAEGMEVGGHVRDIHYSGGDARSTKVGEQIGGTQHTASNINIVTYQMVADVNATRNRLASIMVVSTPRTSPTTSENIPTMVGSDDPLFHSRLQFQPLRWKEVQCKTLLIDGMEMLMALIVYPNPFPYLLENFLQQALLWKSEKMDSIMMLKEYGTGLYQALVVQIIEFYIRRLLQLRKPMQ
jgi:hypothetical protein